MFRTDTLLITPDVLGMIARIDEFKGAWRALGTLAPDRLSALRRVATIESIGSSTRIEGSKLTDREVERLLSNLAIKKFETRDEQEVAGYAELMDLVLYGLCLGDLGTAMKHQVVACIGQCQGNGATDAAARPCDQNGRWGDGVGVHAKIIW